MSEKIRVAVTIAGMDFQVVGTEPADYVRRLAKFVDRKIAEKLEANSRLGTTSAAVLAAMGIADELQRSEGNYRVLKESLERSCEDYEKCRRQLAALKEKHGEL
jgi:cell division protein ZapA